PVIKSRDGHAPGALTADAPVRARLDRALDAVHTPIRDPFNLINFAKCPLAKLVMVDLDEPLVHRPENDRGLAPPAVRIAVMIVLLMQQGMTNPELVQHDLIRLTLAMLLQD